MRFIPILFILWSSCHTPTNHSTMNNIDQDIFKISSSLPSPVSNTMLMFDLLEKEGEYTLPNGEVKTGQLITFYSTDGDHIPRQTTGIGGEIDMLGYRYKLIKIIRSEDYTISADEAWLDVIGEVK